jgi:hypothetical protein
MGWLSDLFSGFQVRDVVQPLMSVFAGNQVQDANRRAAEIVQQTNQQAAGMVGAGNNAAVTELNKTRTAAAPGMSHLSSVVAGYQPGVMTPQQAEKLRQMRTQAGRQLTSKLGGRSAVAVGDDLFRRGEAQFLEENQRRADSAAGGLAGQSAAATNAIANVNLNAGNTGARLISEGGQAAAGATTANAAVEAGTMANALQSVFARDRTDERRSRYETPQP